MSTQGSLNVIQKEDIVNQKTPNFSFSERRLAFTENQQEFLRELGFTNSVDGDNSVLGITTGYFRRAVIQNRLEAVHPHMPGQNSFEPTSNRNHKCGHRQVWIYTRVSRFIHPCGSCAFT